MARPMSYYGWSPYVPVAQRRERAARKIERLRRSGHEVAPVAIQGRKIATTFWGISWCEILEAYSDYANRLPRGRTYVRNGSVVDLQIADGQIRALVSGSDLYEVDLRVKPLSARKWKRIRSQCAGRVDSLVELLQGRISDAVMGIVTRAGEGLFPTPGEISLDCSCPDWATMCKHVAAVLYGVGSRLDDRPELLFTLRDVDPQDLIATDMTLPDTAGDASPALSDDQLGAIFDIDIEPGDTPASAPAPATKPKKKTSRRGAKQTKRNKRASRKKPTTSPKLTPKSRSTKHAKPIRRDTSIAARPKPNLRPTGKSIARLRRQLGLTVTQFAQQLGASASSVYRWESTNGRLQLQDRCLEALAALRRSANQRRG